VTIEVTTVSKSLFFTMSARDVSRSVLKQTKAIENLTKENEELREQIAGQRKKMSEIQKQVADNEIISRGTTNV
jgi:hypothetical protein